jgi:large subunit ribosomal protein L3
MNAKLQRTGLIAEKVGMTQVFDDEGNLLPVTLLKADNNLVVEQKTENKDGYNALVIGFKPAKERRVNKPQKAKYAKLKAQPMQHVKEFRVSADALVEPGKKLSIAHFSEGQLVDVVGTSIGKGFAGAMKRHNFAGLEASHGVSVSHRAHGATGQCQDPGRVFKGKKMAGHLGDQRVTVQNIEVVEIDQELGLIALYGAIPGHKGSIVYIKDAVKKAIPMNAPYPAAILEDSASATQSKASSEDASEEKSAEENEK